MDVEPVSATALGGAPAGGGLDVQAEARDIRFDPTARKAVALRNRLLLGLSFSAGVIDIIAFLGLGKVFTAFQTGNVVFLGLGLAGKGPQGVPLPNTAWPQRVTVALVITAVSQAAFLIGWIATSGHPIAAAGATLVAIMAFGMGVQIHAARSLGVPDVSTTAATATWVTFVSDIATKDAPGQGPIPATAVYNCDDPWCRYQNIPC